MRAAEPTWTLTLAMFLAVSACGGGWEPTGGPGGGTPLPPGLVGIGVAPLDPTVTLGEQVQFVATGFYDDQTTRTVTDSVDWTTTTPAVFDISSDLDSEGLGTATGTGQARVACSFYGLPSNEVRVTVTEATITGIEVTPDVVRIHAGETVQLAAEATFSDGSRGDVSGSVRWVTGEPAVATVEAGGAVTGQAVGSTQVRVLYETGSDTFEGSPATVEVLDGDVAIDEADVRILGFSAAASGEQVVYTLQVKNSGGSPASSFWVDVWLNRTAAPPLPPTSGDGHQLVSLLEAGASVEVNVQVGGAGPGTWTSWAMVDSFGGVPEGSLGESNNLWGPETVEVTGSGGPIGPDLSITWLQAWVQESQVQVLYVFDVTNNGDAVAPAFSVGVFADPGFPPVAPSHPDELVDVPELGPGQTAYLSQAVRDMPEQWWQSWVLADTWDDVAEPNEGNNVAGVQVVP